MSSRDDRIDDVDSIDRDSVGGRMIRSAIENDGVAVAKCSECNDTVFVNRFGLACGHDPDQASILDDSFFDEPSRLDRLRLKLRSLLETLRP